MGREEFLLEELDKIFPCTMKRLTKKWEEGEITWRGYVKERNRLLRALRKRKRMIGVKRKPPFEKTYLSDIKREMREMEIERDEGETSWRELNGKE